MASDSTGEDAILSLLFRIYELAKGRPVPEIPPEWYRPSGMRKFGFWGPLGCLILAGALHLFFPNWADPPKAKYLEPSPYWEYCLYGAGTCAGIAWFVFYKNKRWFDLLFLWVSHGIFGCFIALYLVIGRWERILLVVTIGIVTGSWGIFTGIRRLLDPSRLRRSIEKLDAALDSIKNNQWETALALLNASIRLDPTNAHAWLTRGLLHADLDHDEQAITDLTRALELDPEFEDAYEMRGILHGRAGRLDQAIIDFSSAIEENGLDGSLYVYRAEAYLFSGFYDKAWGDITEARKRGIQHGTEIEEALRQIAPHLEPHELPPPSPPERPRFPA